MELKEAVEFIRPALWQLETDRIWADLGSGDGLFSRALATLLTPGSTIHAVDKTYHEIEPSINGNTIVFHPLDFTEGVLPFAQLDGILMANSLHFVKDKRSLISNLRNFLRPGGQLLVIEYELEKGNQWIPYPIPYISLEIQMKESGFSQVEWIGERKSLYGGRKMYVCTGR